MDAEATATRPTRGSSVVLVSGDPITAARLEQHLEAVGRVHTVRQVDDVPEAAALLVREPGDVVIVDLSSCAPDRLPALDDASPGTPIIGVVAPDGAREVGATAIRHGAHDYVVDDATLPLHLSRSLRLVVEQQRLVRLVVEGARQREALAHIEAKGRRVGTVVALLAVVVDEVGAVVPDAAVCARVATRTGEVSQGTARLGEHETSVAWAFDSAVGPGELLVCQPPDQPLTEHERSFLDRAASMTATALDALSTTTDLQLRGRQLEMLYELSRGLVTCIEVDEVLDLVPPALLDAVRPRDGAHVTVVVEGSAATAGPAPPRPATETRTDITVAGEAVGSVVVTHAEEVHSPVEATLVAHTAELVGEWLTRRQVEHERDSRRRWTELILQQLPAVLWTVDTELRFTSLTGSALDDIDPPPRLGQTLVEHFGGDDQHVSVQRHREALQGSSTTYSLSWLGTDWEVAVTPLHDRQGTIVGATGVGLDVTARQAALHRADRERERYRELFEQSRDAIVLMDDDGRFTAVNPAMCALVGRSREDLLGARAEDLAADSDSAQRLRELLDERRPGADLRDVLRLARPDGSVVAAEFNATADVVDHAHLAILRDITTQQQVRRELEVSEHRFRALAEGAIEGIFRISLAPARTYVYANPALERITGFSRGELLEDGTLLRRRTHAEDVVDDTIEGVRTVRFQRADGEWRWLEIRQTPVTDEDGAPVAVQGLVMDVTDQKRHADALEAALAREQQATEDLRRLDQLKNAFLRAASHELRTPLAAIYGIAATLHTHRDRIDPGTTDHLWERLDVNVERLRVLLDDLLDVNRLTTDVVTPAIEHLDLADLARSVADEVPMGNRTLRLTVQPTPATVEPSKVERILHNLLANAVKHTPEGTTVTVETRPGPDGAAVLVVADDGPGIEPDIRDRLFEPFVQGRAAATSPSPGTGIGLSLVKQFTELHEGSITVDASGQGGARFEVVLPAWIQGQPDGAEPPPSMGAGGP